MCLAFQLLNTSLSSAPASITYEERAKKKQRDKVLWSNIPEDVGHERFDTMMQVRKAARQEKITKLRERTVLRQMKAGREERPIVPMRQLPIGKREMVILPKNAMELEEPVHKKTRLSMESAEEAPEFNPVAQKIAEGIAILSGYASELRQQGISIYQELPAAESRISAYQIAAINSIHRELTRFITEAEANEENYTSIFERAERQLRQDFGKLHKLAKDSVSRIQGLIIAHQRNLSRAQDL